MVSPPLHPITSSWSNPQLLFTAPSHPPSASTWAPQAGLVARRAGLEACPPNQNPSTCMDIQAGPPAHMLAWDPTPQPIQDPSTYMGPYPSACRGPFHMHKSPSLVHQRTMPAYKVGTLHFPLPTLFPARTKSHVQVPRRTLFAWPLVRPPQPP